MKIITLLLILLAVSSCATNTNQDDAKEPYKLEYTFYTDKNYQQVYRDILKKSYDCRKQNTLSKMLPKGELFSEIKAADILITVHGIFGDYTHLTINIEAENDITKVHVVNDFESWDKLAQAIKSWIVNGSSACE